MASLVMLILSLIPQLHLWVVRGSEWNGAYVSPQSDEPLYSAYVNSLIDGRTRKNDPFGDRDDSLEAPLPESIFSIQFVPAYLIAMPARLFGLSAASAFIVLIAAAALLSSFSVFWLLSGVVDDSRVAAAGTLFVLCLGGVVGKYGLFGTFIDIPFPVLPFLRRYAPSAAFPLFFVFHLAVWRGLTARRKAAVLRYAVIAGATLVIMIYSYLYLWTAAAAWFACIAVLWLCFRRSDRKNGLTLFLTISGITLVGLVPYVYMLSRRASMLDEQQIMLSTHFPDLLRVHEIIGATILVALLIGIRRKKFSANDPKIIYAASLSLLPFVVFNQQVITGKTMQVFHFESYVVNYSTMVGLIITAALLLQPLSRRLLVWASAVAVAWALVAVGLPARLAFVPSAIDTDKTIPVFMRLKELAAVDGTKGGSGSDQQISSLVFSPDVDLTKWLPTWTSQGTLLDQTGVDCGTITRDERKHFFYMHLYYSNVDPQALRQVLTGTLDPPRDELISAPSAVFGHARIFPQLTSQFDPIQPHEVEREVNVYKSYTESFSRDEALRRPIAYAVIPASNLDYPNLDRWYQRDVGERIGDYFLFRLKLRD
jgi:hypothetical protein